MLLATPTILAAKWHLSGEKIAPNTRSPLGGGCFFLPCGGQNARVLSLFGTGRQFYAVQRPNTFRLLSAILRGPWLLEDGVAEHLRPLAQQFVEGNHEAFSLSEMFEADNLALLAENGDSESVADFTKAKPGSLAHVRLGGVVMKDDGVCGQMGTSSLARLMAQVDANPNIAATVLEMESGGGQVDGTFEAAEAIAGTSKPIVAYVSSMAASAAYALIAGTDHIMASHATASLGSIGVATSFYDTRKAHEMAGVKEHYVVARTSPDKNADILAAREGDYKPLQENTLVPLHKIFQNWVRSARPQVNATALTGGTYLAERAVELGLADSIGTLRDAIATARTLANPKAARANSSQPTKPSKPTTMGIFGTKYPRLDALRNQSEPTAEQLNEANDELAEAGLKAVLITDAQLESLRGIEQSNKSLTRYISELEGKVGTLNMSLSASQAEVSRLGALPGAEATKPVKEGHDQEPKADWYEAVSDLAHNQKADRLFPKILN